MQFIPCKRLVMLDIVFGNERWIPHLMFCTDSNMNGPKYGIHIPRKKLDSFGSFNSVSNWYVIECIYTWITVHHYHNFKSQSLNILITNLSVVSSEVKKNLQSILRSEGGGILGIHVSIHHSFEGIVGSPWEFLNHSRHFILLWK